MKKVKRTGMVHPATLAGIAVLAIGLLFLLAALFLKLAGAPAVWPILAVVAGATSIALAGLSLIAGVLVERPLPENEGRDETPTDG